MQISYFYSIEQRNHNLHCDKKMLKQKINNFLQIISLPIYFWNLCFAYVLNSIFGIFINNKEFETVVIVNKIYFKNTIYLRSFVCCKFVINIQFILEFIWGLYFFSTNIFI